MKRKLTLLLFACLLATMMIPTFATEEQVLLNESSDIQRIGGGPSPSAAWTLKSISSEVSLTKNEIATINLKATESANSNSVGWQAYDAFVTLAGYCKGPVPSFATFIDFQRNAKDVNQQTRNVSGTAVSYMQINPQYVAGFAVYETWYRPATYEEMICLKSIRIGNKTYSN